MDSRPSTAGPVDPAKALAWCFVVAAALFGAALAGSGVNEIVKDAQLRSRLKPVEGTILASGVKRFREAFVTFKYTVDGKGYTKGRYRAVSMDSWTAEGARRIADRYRVGQTYPAWYDAADPSLAVLNRDSEWWFGGVFVLAGVLMPTLFYLIFVRLGPKRASAGSHHRRRRRRRPFARTPHDQAIRIPAAGATLAADIDCIRCGYVLRGLFVTGVCPECGAAVELSLPPDRLLFAHPGWLTMLCIGQVGLLIGPLLLYLWAAYCSIHIAVFGFTRTALPGGGVRFGPPAWAETVAQVLSICAAIVVAGGASLATSPRPGHTETARERRSRVAARRLTTVWCIIVAASVLPVEGMAWLDIAKRELAFLRIATVGLVVGLGLYLSHVVSHIPRPRLARATRVFMVVYAVIVMCSAAITHAVGSPPPVLPLLGWGGVADFAFLMANLGALVLVAFHLRATQAVLRRALRDTDGASTAAESP